ncbi:MAG: DUF624 domain-containing protein [Clostridia bacterium]|nr:DUF624 domain-containing protein [Clostridia bacterium]
MGLFSSSYYKEGPGVEKNERKKKGFFAFFEIFFRNFWGLFVVSFVYSAISVLSLGFANGLAKAGMTHVARSIGREKHSFLLSDFKETIKKNWKQCLAIGIINVFFMAIVLVDIHYFRGYLNREDLKDTPIFQIIGLGIILGIFIISTFIKYYLWTMAITFKLSIKQMIKNGFQFSFLNFGRNILVAILLAVIYFGLYVLSALNPGFMVLAIILLVCVVPGFKALLVHFISFPQIKKYMIDPYYAEHKGEDIEKRRALGLDIPEDELEDEEKEESIFTDTLPAADAED